MKIIEWLELARDAGNVKRMHTTSIIQNHCISDHIYNGILILNELINLIDEEVDRDLLTKHFLIHDIEEVFTGDIPAYIKKDEELNKSLNVIEDNWRKIHLPKSYQLPPLNSKESNIIKLADKIELVMFCMSELKMGNRNVRFLDMVYRCISYMIDIAKVLENKNIMKLCFRIETKFSIYT